MKNSTTIRVSALVPAYNEELEIANVLESLKKSHFIDEIICINDGSTDNTLSQIKKTKGVKLLNLKVNHGKGYAITKGILRAKGEIIIFIDADMRGLNDWCIEKLISPLASGKYDAVIGYPTYGNLDKLFRPISGERSYFKNDLLPLIPKMKKKGYGLELYLNYVFKDKRVKLFPLKGVRHMLKYEKQPYDMVAKLTLIEGFDIIAELLKQKNPLSYLVRSYLYPFYTKRPETINHQINKLIANIKKMIVSLSE